MHEHGPESQATEKPGQRAATRSSADDGASEAVRDALRLQRLVGNRAVSSLLGSLRAGAAGAGRSFAGPSSDVLSRAVTVETTADAVVEVPTRESATRTRAVPGPAAASHLPVQRDLAQSMPVSAGVFEADMRTRQGAASTPPTFSGLDGFIRFVPAVGAPNSSKIVMIQIVKLTDLGGADERSQSIPASRGARGALGQPGVRTQDDASRGVEGGFFTDVHHQANPSATPAAAGSALSPNFNFQPAGAGVTGVAGSTPTPAGGTGGVVGQTPGFKRSDDAADIRSAALFDTPGSVGRANLIFEFESVAKGEDTQVVYGTVRWGFTLRNGVVENDHITPLEGASATFVEALERHRDFYVHEPVTFHFPFASAELSTVESAKIDELIPYMTRNPRAQISLEGFADIRGGASRFNTELSLRRAQAVRAELIVKGVDPARISSPLVGSGISTDSTADAGTGDQGGDAAAARDRDRAENRQFNRRVVATFSPAAAPAPAVGP
ncbi:OmpA family protein [Cellulomonas cellasea]|nr:OmpA family protein [Cellulomonas cellasea]GEA86734.1 hypothetical protein CCE01nite_06830 [Cellulomonas cellasea]